VSTPGSGAFDATFAAGSRDGSRVQFDTTEPNPSLGDTDAKNDVYECRAKGGLRLITAAGSGPFDAFFQDSTLNGSRIWFRTKEPNPGSGDIDTSFDAYGIRWGVPTNTSAPVLSGEGLVGQTLTCAPGPWTGEAFALSTGWLRSGTPIGGQTGATYTVTAADTGTLITLPGHRHKRGRLIQRDQ
jgi:hypothetical protein